jgi:Holliday junction resolvase RusA-like endonuclease
VTEQNDTPARYSLLPVGGRDQDGIRARLLAQALAPGVSTQDVVVLTLSGSPASKTRPRFSKDGRTYKTAEDQQAEARTGWQLRRAFRQPWTGNLALGCVFFRPDRQRIDVDNLVKHVCDAGNGIAWADDAQITALYAVAEVDPEYPRTLLVVARHTSSLDRAPARPRTPRRKAVTR